MTLHAITVLGHDRPGIIAEATGILSSLGLNLEDSSMTLLRGHFAMTLISAGDAASAEIEAALVSLTEGGDLSASVRELTREEATPSQGRSWVLSVHGGDRPGIVSSVVGRVAAVGGNVTDLTTRLAGDLYVLVAELDLPVEVDVDTLRDDLREVAAELGVGVSLHEVEADEL
ncbi:amino acid-binding protein [Nocardioides sp. Soil797]|nr:amino acid-binding protein [Nocardioides sp. Soil797]